MLEEISHRSHHKMMVRDFKRRFLFSLLLTIPILILSPMIQSFLNYNLSFSYSDSILSVLSTIVFFYGGWPFLVGLYRECKKRNIGMMTLIGVAITVSYIYSVAVIFGLDGKMFFWELVTLIDIMLLGHWIEMKSVLGASRSLEFLVSLMPATAHLIEGKEVKDIPLKDLRIGDLVLIKPGERISADGVIVDGYGYIDESMLTGESKPSKKNISDMVIGGSINGQGSFKVKVKHSGNDSYLAKVIGLVQDAQKSKSKTEGLVDRAAKWLTLIALTVGFFTLIAWLLFGQTLEFSLERMVTVMVITCPHALGLAIPLVIAISTTLSAKHGLLIRNRTAFENSRKISTLVFDKTGTLTEGKFVVIKHGSFDKRYSENDIIRYAASLEQNSEHPIANSILHFLKDKKTDLFDSDNFQAISGMGVEGKVNGRYVKVVSPLYLRVNKISFDRVVSGNSDETLVFVLIDNQVVGYIKLADQIRRESYATIKALKDSNIKIVMLTGDNQQVAKSVSERLGIDNYYAELLPHEKLEMIKKMQDQGEFVAMVGDGVNDAPALAEANIGIAIGSGTDIAAETADIILVASNPKEVVSLISFAKKTYSKMMQNLLWALGYNIFAIPLAAGVLYHYKIMLNPAVGAILMTFSTVVVAFNALFLKWSVGTKNVRA